MLTGRMVLSGALAALGRLFQREPATPAEELASYSAEVVPVLARAERLYQDWLELSALFAEPEKLANTAAIHRWEAATMRQALGRLTPPPVLAQPHAELMSALLLTSRASQLLSNGNRFHNASAVCDGQTLLEESRKRRLAAAGKIHRVLERGRDRADVSSVESRELVGTGPISPDSIEPGRVQP